MKTLTIDPVCRKEVGAHSRFHLEYGGVCYVFCCEKCWARFRRDPGEFIPAEGENWDALDLNLLQIEPKHSLRQTDLIPLLLAPGLAFLIAATRQLTVAGPWRGTGCLLDFTGLFLIFLAAFKLCELRCFAEMFRNYDFLAQWCAPYAYLYPFLELGLGLGLLANRYVTQISAATAGLMIFCSLGMLVALRKGRAASDATSAGPLKIPLSTATLVANLSVAMSAAILSCFSVL